jgi:hypothetical protein
MSIPVQRPCIHKHFSVSQRPFGDNYGTHHSTQLLRLSVRHQPNDKRLLLSPRIYGNTPGTNQWLADTFLADIVCFHPCQTINTSAHREKCTVPRPQPNSRILRLRSLKKRLSARTRQHGVHTAGVASSGRAETWRFENCLRHRSRYMPGCPASSACVPR